MDRNTAPQRWLRIATNARLTAALFVLFLLFFALGILLPQTPFASAEQMQEFVDSWPNLAPIADRLGLLDVYHSAWMYGLFGAFSFQLLIYLVTRARRLLRESRRLQAESPEGFATRASINGDRQTLAALATRLGSRRYRVRVDSERLIAVKHGLSSLWGLVFHASFIVLLAGAWILRASEFHGAALVTEGQVFHGAELAYNDTDRDVPRVGFLVRSIEPEFADGKRASDILVTLELEDGSSAELRVNQPVAFDDAEVLIKNFGLAPVFSVWQLGEAEPQLVDMFSPRLISWSPGLPVDSFRLKHPPATVEARFYPDASEIDVLPAEPTLIQKDPVLSLKVRPDGETVEGADGQVRIGESLPIGDHELRLEGLRTWGEFLVSRQAGTVLLIGFLLMVLGATLRMLFPRRELLAELRHTVSGGQIEIGGRGEFFPASFRWELDELVAGLSAGDQAEPQEES